jgi:histidyl-tRNA synthetase
VRDAYIDLWFARGLAYYTGFIFEVLTPYLNFSIGGGGRYDTLISLYGGPPTPSTGYSLGVDRLHLALKEEGWTLPEKVGKLLLISMIDDVGYVDKVARKLRELNLVVDVRFGRKVSALLSYAVRKGFDYVGIVGSEEYGEGAVTVKNLSSRVQKKLYVDSLDAGELP